MSDRNAALDLYNVVKTVVDNYIRNRKPAAVLLGTYTGSAMQVGAMPVPMDMVTGNMKQKLVSGDKVRLLRNDGGHEYYILEIIGKPYLTGGG